MTIPLHAKESHYPIQSPNYMNIISQCLESDPLSSKDTQDMIVVVKASGRRVLALKSDVTSGRVTPEKSCSICRVEA